MKTWLGHSSSYWCSLEVDKKVKACPRILMGIMSSPIGIGQISQKSALDITSPLNPRLLEHK